MYFHGSIQHLASDFRLHPSLGGSRQNMFSGNSVPNGNSRIAQQRAYSMGECNRFQNISESLKLIKLGQTWIKLITCQAKKSM